MSHKEGGKNWKRAWSLRVTQSNRGLPLITKSLSRGCCSCIHWKRSKQGRQAKAKQPVTRRRDDAIRRRHPRVQGLWSKRGKLVSASPSVFTTFLTLSLAFSRPFLNGPREAAWNSLPRFSFFFLSHFPTAHSRISISVFHSITSSHLSLFLSRPFYPLAFSLSRSLLFRIRPHFYSP